MKNSAINVTTLFGVTSHVSITSRRAHSAWNLILNNWFSQQEWLCFAAPEMKNPAVLEHFNENFHIELPFRGCELDYESEVSTLVKALHLSSIFSELLPALNFFGHKYAMPTSIPFMAHGHKRTNAPREQPITTSKIQVSNFSVAAHWVRKLVLIWWLSFIVCTELLCIYRWTE